MFQKFIQNHVLANLFFVLVLILGTISYLTLPREKNPTINFNWIQVTTALPGASAIDIEKRITDPLEDVIRSISDIKFVSSNSREGISSILIRFNDVSERIFDKRVADLRREIQSKQNELPSEATDPFIFEITTDNAYPTASIVAVSAASDENLRLQSERLKKQLENIKGVDRVMTTALDDPELQVFFDPQKLQHYGIKPSDLADTIRSYYQDTPAGSLKVQSEEWFIRLTGANASASTLANLPVLTSQAGEVPLSEIAEVKRGREKASQLVSYNNQAAVLFALTKKSKSNTLGLVERLNDFVAERNLYSDNTGVHLVLIDDATEITNRSINVMQTNALVGLLFVLFVTWIFLGVKIAFLTSIGIPFILAGTFWVISLIGQSLNIMVLLGVVISLGMLVDDAVVVAEAIYQRLARGADRVTACIEALKEVATPVTTAVLTTMSAFLPLVLMPGIMGKFMMVVPLVVSIGLAISLIEAFWMLPAHVLVVKTDFENPSKMQLWRQNFTHQLQIKYIRSLIKVMRYPKRAMVIIILPFLLAIGSIAAEMVKVDFFASDPIRKFYVNIEMPPGTPLEDTLTTTLEIEKISRSLLSDEETRALVSYAGQMFTENEPFFGNSYGQIMISLNPDNNNDYRHVDDVLDEIRGAISDYPGPINISFFRLAGGPPTAKPISVKVRGDDLAQIHTAANALKEILRDIPAIKDINDDASKGRNELNLVFDSYAIQNSGLTPADIARNLRLLVDGEIVASMQHMGEELEVRVKAKPRDLYNVEEILYTQIVLPNGNIRPLSYFLSDKTGAGPGNIRHYNYRRAITVEADLDTAQMNTVEANNLIKKRWLEIADLYTENDLNFSGQLDDINESINSMFILLLFGVLLIYAILGTQFKSYFQPLIILSTVPMAFTGVTLGLLITSNPLSLYTLYGVVALAGIAVNAAIVLISAANSRLQDGMSITHATIYAARRRVIPILITTLTTIAGLSSLALGLGGESLIWGPVATAIVWGLAFSSVLTLFAIPLIFRLFVKGV
ncbi:RND multidrug efflux transporter; Acriflavin resistance protein [hydrothermal vent metagenome]|uniref:RND multidrug efflux transporter Acriflavin resistance protein n=1 Tax=hydrothermal vent metagenome TaxID=652676 RepID=A0A3B0WLM0_9ZZZZ